MKKIANFAGIIWTTAIICCANASAQPGRPVAPLPGVSLAGQGTLRFLGFDIYHARLWVSPGFEPEDYAAKPLALELIYRRGFTAQEIAERSMEEMRRVAPITPQQAARWQQALQSALPDVKAGDRIIGLYRPGEGVVFERDGLPTGEVKDPYFSRVFFGIWLSPHTSEPRLRQALIAGHRVGQP